MIKLDIERRCHGCPEFKPSTDKTTYWAAMGVVEQDTRVRCKHEDKCRRIEEYLRRQMREENKE